MHDPSPTAGTHASAVTTDPEWPPSLGDRWAAAASESLERTRLIEQARRTDAAAQLRRCCPSAARVLEDLSWRALTRLAANEPVDPNDPDSWRSPDAHAQVVLRRHGITGLDSHAADDGRRAGADRRPGARRPRRRPGLDAARRPGGAARRSAAARARAAADRRSTTPRIYAYRDDQRRALAAPARRSPASRPATCRAGLLAPPRRLRPRRPALLADRLARPGWRSPTSSCRRSSASSGRSGCSSRPPSAATAGSSRRCSRSTRSGCSPRSAAASSATCAPRRCPLERRRRRCSNASTRARCTPGRSEQPRLRRRARAGAHARARHARSARACRARSATAGAACSSAAAATPAVTAARAPSSRCACSPSPAAAFPRRRLGAAPRDEHAAQPSAVMELGEAVQTAIERGLPLLLSSEAAGAARATRVRVGRMKGRPGVLTITTADGRRAPPRAASSPSRRSPSCARSSDAGAKVTLDAGARQLVRMTLRAAARRRPGPARPPARDRRAEGRRLRRRRHARPAPARRSPPAARSRTAPPPRRASAR